MTAIIAWIQAKLVYIVIIGAAAFILEMDGYRRGIGELLEYKGKQATAAVSVVTKIRMVDNDELSQLQVDYNVLYADYVRLLHDAANGGSGSLASAAASLDACPDPDRHDEARRDSLPTAERLLADVEDAVLAHLETGDTEIIKYRRLSSRDIRISNVKP